MALARAHAAQGARGPAIQHYQAAVAGAPDAVEARFGLGAALLQAGRFRDAVEQFERTVALKPDHAEGFNNLGSALRELGRLPEAIAAFEQAVRLRPDYVRALSNLGVALTDAGQPARAIDALRRALDLQPDHPGALNNLGHVLKAQRDHDGAVEIFARLAALRPDDAEPLLNVGLVEQAREDHAAACAAFERALARRVDARGWFCLGKSAAALGETARARDAYRTALALDPSDVCGAGLALAVMGEADVPTVAPERYVAELFDGYAARFENELVGNLHYRAPEILHALFIPHVALGEKLDIVDLGCGTGLGGAAFRSLARRLDGIDLSPKMIEQARARAIYDELTVGELVASLRALAPARYELALATDVLVYFGDLGPLLDAVKRVLRPGGRFLFSVERDTANDHAYSLHDGHRYAHGRSYVAAQANLAGYAVVTLEDTATRIDRGEPVPSLAVLLRAG
ncbi:MAG: tetratricopeptide repeat protein [Alphaproteobacteria bacterium]|nr:tetratricopeptide repeat protein [Alphaproteobacteria bacterium]